MSKGRDDLPTWACLVGILPAMVGFVLGLGFAVSFLIYVGVTTAMIIVWLLDSILVELRSQKSRVTQVLAGDD